MDIRLYYEFAVLARTLNYHDAAEQLQVSQSTLSRHIVELENHYRLQLFYRDKYHVSLTNEGAAFYDSALAIWRAYEESERVARECSSTGCIVIGGVLNTALLYPYIAEAEKLVRSQSPDFSIKMSIHDSSSLKEQVELLRRGEMTCSAVYYASRLQNDCPDVAVDHICDLPVEAVVSTGAPLAGKASIELEDMAGCTLLQLVSPRFTPVWKCIRYEFESLGLPYQTRPETVGSVYDILAIMRNLDNKTVFLTYRGMLEAFGKSYGLDRSELQAVPVSFEQLHLRLDLIYLRKKESSSIRLFSDALKDAFAGVSTGSDL